jgi:uncharacterized protein
MSKKIRILSIDGGGIRGIIPAVILNYIEDQIRVREGNDKRLAEYFDMIAGTSTGGILACAYLTPGNDLKPKYSASDALSFYLKRGHQIFNVDFWQEIRSAGSLADEKYPAKELEQALKDYFGDLRLSEFLKPSLITAYDIRNRNAKFFNKIDAVNDIRDFYVRDIARATSAAPTYFEVSDIHSIYGAPYYLIDGGVFANNPAMCAYAEARTTDFAHALGDDQKSSYPFAKDMIMVSIGTGSHPDPYYFDKAKNWGALGWLLPLIDILMSGNSETVHYQLKQLFDTLGEPEKNNYIRLEPTVGDAKHAMDIATPENMSALVEAGKHFVDNNMEKLDEIVEKLIVNK